MVAVFYTVAGVERVAAKLRGLELAGSNLTAAMEAAALRLEEGERRQFSSEGGYGTGAWKPLSPRYRDWKDRHFPGEPILQLRHRLIESLTSAASPDAVREVTPFSLTFGSRVPYGIFHQHGIPGRMPARPPLVLTPADKGQITLLIKRAIMEHLNAPAGSL
jgi:phage gpG-like protein